MATYGEARVRVNVEFRTEMPYNSKRVCWEGIMETVSVNQFRDHLKQYVEAVTHNHDPLIVTRRNGENFVVISESDWRAEQETLYVLQNQSLMAQMTASLKTFNKKKGKRLTKAQQDEIDRI